MLRLGLRNGEIIGIGSLEARVLRALYEHGDWVPVMDVLRRLEQDGQISYSSVVTCLKRMADKGYLEARKRKGDWLFRPAMGAYEFGLILIQTIWQHIWGPPPAALSQFVTDALTGKLGEEGVPEEMKQIARQTEDLGELIQELSAPEGTAQDGDADTMRGANCNARSRQRRKRTKGTAA
jgi:predicted transcriptional regulator